MGFKARGGSGSWNWGSSVLVVVPLLLSTSPGPRCPKLRCGSKSCEMRASSEA